MEQTLVRTSIGGSELLVLIKGRYDKKVQMTGNISYIHICTYFSAAHFTVHILNTILEAKANTITQLFTSGWSA